MKMIADSQDFIKTLAPETVNTNGQNFIVVPHIMRDYQSWDGNRPGTDTVYVAYNEDMTQTLCQFQINTWVQAKFNSPKCCAYGVPGATQFAWFPVEVTAE